MTDEREDERVTCPVCNGLGYLDGFVYCGACWGTGNGAIDKAKADRAQLDKQWTVRVSRLAAADQPWTR